MPRGRDPAGDSPSTGPSRCSSTTPGTPCGGPLEGTTAEQMVDQFTTNVFAPFRLSNQVIPEMRRMGAGRIINNQLGGGMGGDPVQRGLRIDQVRPAGPDAGAAHGVVAVRDQGLADRAGAVRHRVPEQHRRRREGGVERASLRAAHRGVPQKARALQAADPRADPRGAADREDHHVAAPPRSGTRSGWRPTSASTPQGCSRTACSRGWWPGPPCRPPAPSAGGPPPGRPAHRFQEAAGPRLASEVLAEVRPQDPADLPEHGRGHAQAERRRQVRGRVVGAAP